MLYEVITPKGELKLRIIASEDKQPIEGARIFIKGTTIEGRTDVNGSFSTELPQGVQTVSVIHGRFSTQTINAIEIAADSTTERVVEMTRITSYNVCYTKLLRTQNAEH